MSIAEIDLIRAFFIVVLATMFIILPAYFTGKIALDKGYGLTTFVVIGVILGLLGPVLAALLPRRKSAG